MDPSNDSTRLTDAERLQFINFMKHETHTEVHIPLARAFVEGRDTPYLNELFRRLWR